jgi:tRNA (cmo5U34)-methyltransferase
LHHLITDEDKKLFYIKIYNSLNENGIFFNLDVVLGSNAYLQEYYMKAWKKYLRKGYSKNEVEEIIKQYYYEDSPAKLMDQIKWLENIGFKNVDVVRKYYNFAIYGGTK